MRYLFLLIFLLTFSNLVSVELPRYLKGANSFSICTNDGLHCYEYVKFNPANTAPSKCKNVYIYNETIKTYYLKEICIGFTITKVHNDPLYK